MWLIWCRLAALKVKDNLSEPPESWEGASPTGEAFHVAFVVVTWREWLYVNDGEKGHSISAAPPAELRMTRGRGAPVVAKDTADLLGERLQGKAPEEPPLCFCGRLSCQ